MKRFIMSTVLALAATTAYMQKPAIVASDKSGWHKIGETTVDFTKEEDQVAVLLADKFALLKFKVTQAAIEVIDLDVVFEEGDKQNIRIGQAIKPEGSESKPIDLKSGAERRIKRVIFRYRTVDNKEGERARVEIWGKKTNPDKGDGKEERADKKDKAQKDVKEAGREAKKDTKEATREAKKEARETKKKAKKEVKETKQDIQDN